MVRDRGASGLWLRGGFPEAMPFDSLRSLKAFCIARPPGRATQNGGGVTGSELFTSAGPTSPQGSSCSNGFLPAECSA